MRNALVAVLLSASAAWAQCEPLPLSFDTDQYTGCFVEVLRPADIAWGPDLGREKTGTPSWNAVNMTGLANTTSPPWLALYDPTQLFGDQTTCVDLLLLGTNGEKAGGVAALCGAKCVTFAAADARGTDTMRLRTVDTLTGAMVTVKTGSLAGQWVIYAGSDPKANCDCRPDGACHEYCQWGKVCLTTQTNADATVTYTGKVWLHGEGAPGDWTRASPYDPTLTLIGSLAWTGARPVGTAVTGPIGLFGSAIQTNEAASFKNFGAGP